MIGIKFYKQLWYRFVQGRFLSSFIKIDLWVHQKSTDFLGKKSILFRKSLNKVAKTERDALLQIYKLADPCMFRSCLGKHIDKSQFNFAYICFGVCYSKYYFKTQSNIPLVSSTTRIKIDFFFKFIAFFYIAKNLKYL